MFVLRLLLKILLLPLFFLLLLLKAIIVAFEDLSSVWSNAHKRTVSYMLTIN